jgi:hypothetical protein
VNGVAIICTSTRTATARAAYLALLALLGEIAPLLAPLGAVTVLLSAAMN